MAVTFWGNRHWFSRLFGYFNLYQKDFKVFYQFFTFIQVILTFLIFCDLCFSISIDPRKLREGIIKVAHQTT